MPHKRLMTQTASNTPALTLSIDGAIAWITADNASRMNALTSDMWAAVPRHVAAAEADANVRVIILRGAGSKAFSAGADISEFETARTGDAAAHYDGLNQAAFEALSGCSKPTLAMIHGFCIGGGLAIAACCDLRFADEASQFAIPAAKLGIGYNPRWVRTLLALSRPSDVKELLFTGRRFSSSEALAMGLVNRVFTADTLETETRATAATIAANAPLTVKAAKLAIDELSAHPENTDTARLDAAAAACFSSNDYAEGRRAFLEKRKPQFKGR
jgi:enoyl-CoA hydratase